MKPLILCNPLISDFRSNIGGPQYERFRQFNTMDFKDTLKQVSERVVKLKENLQTEEATKNALIMPFIQAIGYDVFNPFEVVPEYTCDIGTKKGEKIDYAILKDNIPVILVECKHWAENLNDHDNQLLRYYHVSCARFGILTNGIEYRFYTDLEEPNKMDSKPFLVLNMLDLRDNEIEEVKQFHKSYFDVDSIMNAASELKFMKGLKDIITSEMATPSEPLVRLFAKQVYTGVITSKILELFTDLIRRSFSQVMSDTITDRFKTALSKETEKKPDETTSVPGSTTQYPDDMSDKDSKIITTEEEKEGYLIIRGILRKYIDVARIECRDTQSYFGVLLDDNNRKPVCRLYFNGSKKYIATFDENKKETRNLIDSLDDLYKYEESLAQVISFYNK